MRNQYYWVYILFCQNGTYYTGYTVDLIKRYQDHLAGSASKYTRSFKPLKIAQSWQIEGKSLAMKVECRIKKMSKKEKQALILHPERLIQSDT